MIPLVVHATIAASLGDSNSNALLHGLLGTAAYGASVGRSILAGAQPADSAPSLRAFGDRVDIRYDGLQAASAVEEGLRAAFQQIEQRYEVALLYGTVRLGENEHEVLLVDATRPNQRILNDFKYFVWKHFGIDSTRYGGSAEYEKQLGGALPLLEALRVLAPAAAAGKGCLLVAHDWPGLPLLLAAQIESPEAFRTLYFAHELPAARAIVESHPGHDTRFYNALFQAREWQLGLETVFGSQETSFRHALIRQSVRADALLAAGDLVVEELHFLGGGFYHAPVDLVYGGIPSVAVGIEERNAARSLLRDYGLALTGARPDFVFTHVAPLATAGGFWRDARVLEHLDGLLRGRGERALLLVLAAGAQPGIEAARSPAEIAAWEAAYGWPLNHRSGGGDLAGHEATYYLDVVEPFNRRATHTRIAWINQEGWEPGRRGTRWPPALTAETLRHGTDAEFGQSIYEPFGMGQLASLSAGALAVVSSVCGCVGAVSRATRGTENLANLVVADYCTLPPGYWLGSPYDALAIDQGVRDWIESANSAAVARVLFDRLPRSQQETRALLESGARAAAMLSWERAASDWLLPALARVAARS